MKQPVISAPALEGACEGPLHLESDTSGRVFRMVCLSCGGILDQELAERLHQLLEDRGTSAARNIERRPA